MSRDDDLYMLINGTWSRIARDLVEEVNDFVSSLPPSALRLPDARLGEHEFDYNRRAGELDERLHVLDRELVSGSATEGRVEACDLFGEDGVFVHVKRYTRGSADLSHLFAQASVSAHAFLREPMFRSDLRDLLTEHRTDQSLSDALVPDERPEPADYEIAYAIIAPGWSDRGWTLPFFAKLTLMQLGGDLGDLGFNVTLTPVPLAGA